MLLDIGTVLAGIGLAIVGFVVVVVVCAVILALLASILPSYEGRTTAERQERAATEDDPKPDAVADVDSAPDREVYPAPGGEGDPAPGGEGGTAA